MGLDECALLEALAVAARDAGAEILKLVAAGFEVETKSDLSPVTVCDRAAEAVILAALAPLQIYRAGTEGGRRCR